MSKIKRTSHEIVLETLCQRTDKEFNDKEEFIQIAKEYFKLEKVARKNLSYHKVKVRDRANNLLTRIGQLK